MDSTVHIDWDAHDSYWLLNPRSPLIERQWVDTHAAEINSELIWLRTSGSSSERWRWVGLSRKAILASAKAVNERLEVSEKDVWLKALPSFHIGGLAILARAHLSQSRMIEFPFWKISQFLAMAESERVSLVSLVPTQLYDLVKSKARAPHSLRAVIVGGGALNPSLYFEARSLGWPVLPSFGMTECASQVATALLDSLENEAYPEMIRLPHLLCEVDDEGVLKVSGDSLLAQYCDVDPDSGQFRLYDPKKSGWLFTEDLCRIRGDAIEPLGRRTSVVKVGGELVNFDELNQIWRELDAGLASHSILLGVPCARLGHRPVLVIEQGLSQDAIEATVTQFLVKVPPFCRPREIYRVRELPRSPLGKILVPKVSSSLGY